MKPPNTETESVYPAYVGPYKIGKTLGQGQTGESQISEKLSVLLTVMYSVFTSKYELRYYVHLVCYVLYFILFFSCKI